MLAVLGGAVFATRDHWRPLRWANAFPYLYFTPKVSIIYAITKAALRRKGEKKNKTVRHHDLRRLLRASWGSAQNRLHCELFKGVRLFPSTPTDTCMVVWHGGALNPIVLSSLYAEMPLKENGYLLEIPAFPWTRTFPKNGKNYFTTSQPDCPQIHSPPPFWSGTL